MAKTRSTGMESGGDVNRLFVEFVLTEDLGFGSPESPATAAAVRVNRTGPGDYDEGTELTVFNVQPYYNRKAGQHGLGLFINGSVRPL